MNKQVDTKIGFAIIFGVALIFLIILTVTLKDLKSLDSDNTDNTNDMSGTSNSDSGNITSEVNPGVKDKITKFSSEQDFKDYLEKSQKLGQSPFYGFGMGGAVTEDRAVNFSAGMEKSADAGAANIAVPQSAPAAPSQASAPDRISDTNVQVLGIDEPDVVKAGDQQIYFSQPQYFARPMPLLRSEQGSVSSSSKIGVVPPSPYPYPYPDETGKTKIINAFPVEDLKVSAEIDKNGDLLLYKNTLIVFAENKQKIYGYDVSNPDEPKEKWTVELSENDELVGARIFGDTVYLSTRSYIKPDHPCPIEPFIVGGNPLKLECDMIYHPSESVPIDLTYNLLSFKADSGEVKQTASFVGSSSASVFYMSDKAIYITYNYPGDFVKLFSNFLGLNSDLIPVSITEKIDKLENYDLSDTAKLTELEDILGHFTRSLNGDEMMRIQNELTNRLEKFSKEHGRELQNTGIVKISIPNLSIAATGRVSGEPLNQFSLDEYQGNLRIATTYSGNFGWIGGIISGSNNNGASDVYVLNENLDNVGKVLDLGKGEKIYSVRFIENKGYVVTFKQVDPFFVLDLSNAKNPQLKGQLKIPGYSSYLHPLQENTILGVGQENGQVKLTLFDVSNPSDPTEMGTYKLDEYYSEIANNHHAFLQDKEHQIFFIPGSKGAYVFSYADKGLKLVKTVSEAGVKRAVYINNLLYIVADNKIIVLDENGWEKVKELDL